jgi:hypothetical protein
MSWLPLGVLAVVLDWSSWLTVASFIPGIVWYGMGEGVRSYKELRRDHPNAPIGRSVPVLYALSLFVVATLFAGRFAGLLIAAGCIYVDLVSLWRRMRAARASVA